MEFYEPSCKKLTCFSNVSRSAAGGMDTDRTACRFCCLPTMLQAQDRDDSKYLAGAVPEVDGKVVFTKEFSIPGMSQDEIYERDRKSVV